MYKIYRYITTIHTHTHTIPHNDNKFRANHRHINHSILMQALSAHMHCKTDAPYACACALQHALFSRVSKHSRNKGNPEKIVAPVAGVYEFI